MSAEYMSITYKLRITNNAYEKSLCEVCAHKFFDWLDCENIEDRLEKVADRLEKMVGDDHVCKG
jgi:hypothetical protein